MNAKNAPEYPEAVRNVFEDFLDRLSADPEFPKLSIQSLRERIFSGSLEANQVRTALEMGLQADDKTQKAQD
jgi:hypothetical protein